VTSTSQALQFAGLYNGGRRLVSALYQVEANVWPLAGISLDGFRPTRNADKLTFTGEPQNVWGAILELHYEKQLGQPSAHWSMTIKEEKIGLRDAVVDGDWIDIQLIRNGVRIPICRGVVDTWRESTVGSGATVRTWRMTGRDHGAFFEYPITWTSIWAQTLGEVVQGLATERFRGQIGGRPDEMLRLFIDAVFGSGKISSQWRIPKALGDYTGITGGIYELLKTVAFNAAPSLEGLRGAYYNEPLLWATGGQTFWQALQQWVNPLLNEIYCDLLLPGSLVPQHGLNRFLASPIEYGEVSIPLPTSEISIPTARPSAVKDSLAAENQKWGTPAILIRERPFFQTINGQADSMWSALPTWYIPTWIIQSSDLGVGGDERYNLFELRADIGFGPTQEQAPQAKPVFHKADIEAHGLRAWQQSTPYLAQFNAGPGAWIRERSTWQRIFVDWYGCAPYLRQGSVQIRAGLPEIHIGQRAILDGGESAREQFYVEGTSLQWHAATKTEAASATTGLILTHGFSGDDDAYFAAVKAHSALFTEAF
jgi:hypothetical protein